MRSLSNHRSHQNEEEEESVFVSMTDMTVSFLFITMILLAFFASQFRPDEQVPLVDHERVIAERDLALAERTAAFTARDLAQERLAASEMEVQRITDELARLRELLSAATETIARVTTERDALRSALAQVEIARDEAISQVETLDRKIIELESEVTALFAKIAPLEAELTRAFAARDLAQERLVASEIEVQRLKDESARLTTERDEALVQVASQAETISELEDRLARLTTERDALRLALAKAETAREEAITVLNAQVDEITVLEAEIDALTEELIRLRQPDPLEAYIAQVAAQREQVLKRLRDAILADFPELEGVITSESDVLRFQGEGLFASGSDAVLPARIPIIERIAERLDDLLPCYTLGSSAEFSEDCNPAFAVIEAVQIEGHTDSDGDDAFNVALSARRGAATYAVMTAHEADLGEHRNLNDQPVLSIAGYGEGRPVARNDNAAGKSTNRRIDLRFIMVTPGKSEEISRIRERLGKLNHLEAQP